MGPALEKFMGLVENELEKDAAILTPAQAYVRSSFGAREIAARGRALRRSAAFPERAGAERGIEAAKRVVSRRKAEAGSLMAAKAERRAPIIRAMPILEKTPMHREIVRPGVSSAVEKLKGPLGKPLAAHVEKTVPGTSLSSLQAWKAKGVTPPGVKAPATSVTTPPPPVEGAVAKGTTPPPPPQPAPAKRPSPWPMFAAGAGTGAVGLSMAQRRKESSVLTKEILSKLAEALPKATPEERLSALAGLSMEAGFNDFILKLAAGAGCPKAKAMMKKKSDEAQEKTASVVKEIDGRKVRFDKLTAEDIVSHLAAQWGRPEDLEKQAAAHPVTAKFATLLAEELSRPT